MRLYTDIDDAFNSVLVHLKKNYQNLPSFTRDVIPDPHDFVTYLKLKRKRFSRIVTALFTSMKTYSKQQATEKTKSVIKLL